MRSRRAAPFALAAVAVIAAFAAAPGGAGASGGAGAYGGGSRQVAPNCAAPSVTRGHEPHTLRFVLPLCQDGFILNGLTIDPGVHVNSTQGQLTIGGGESGDGLGPCRVSADHGRIRCAGSVHGGAVVRGAFRVAGNRCAADTTFTSTGTVDCAPNVACPEIALLFHRRVPKPAGCA